MKNKRLPKAVWQRQRKRVWSRDNYKCTRCGRLLTLNKAHIDHIIPLSKGGKSNMKNLRTLCVACHATRSDPSHFYLWNKCIKNGILKGDEPLWD